MGPPLPAAFRRLWASDALSSAGDGLTLVAAPLLMTTLTSNPILIAGAAAAQQLPWLLFGLLSGAIVDRVDQRRLIIVVDAVRAALIAVLAVAVASGSATVALVYALLFASGSGDTLVVTAGTTLTPRLVERSQLTRANARLLATRLVGGTLLARPIGAWLFTQGHSMPFAVDAVSFAAGIALLLGLRPAPKEPPAGPRRPIGVAEVRDGISYLWHDQVLRTLALCICVMNITYAGTMAVLVLYARGRLGLSDTGFGLLLATLALGGLVGTAVVNPAQRRFGVSALLKVGLVIEAATQLTLAITASPWVAGTALAIFGVHASVWTVLTVSLRQHRVPELLQGRVSSAYVVLSIGGAAAGSVLGGVLVEVGGLTAPMWFGAAVVGVVFLAAMPTFRASAIELGAGRD